MGQKAYTVCFYNKYIFGLSSTTSSSDITVPGTYTQYRSVPGTWYTVNKIQQASRMMQDADRKRICDIIFMFQLNNACGAYLLSNVKLMMRSSLHRPISISMPRHMFSFLLINLFLGLITVAAFVPMNNIATHVGSRSDSALKG